MTRILPMSSSSAPTIVLLLGIEVKYCLLAFVQAGPASLYLLTRKPTLIPQTLVCVMSAWVWPASG